MNGRMDERTNECTDRLVFRKSSRNEPISDGRLVLRNRPFATLEAFMKIVNCCMFPFPLRKPVY